MSFNSSRWKTSDSANPTTQSSLIPTVTGARSAMSPPKPKVQAPRYIEYAGFWLRFWAWLIDTALLIGVLGAPFILSEGLRQWTTAEFTNTIIIWSVLVVTPWLYFAYMESASGATIGKQAFGLKVTDLEGNNITFIRATGRYFGKFVSRLILDIGYVMVAFTEKKQGLHDMMAGCLVVKDIR